MEENKNTNPENANANAEAQKHDQAADQPAPKTKKPFYKKGWFWGVVGVVAAVGGVGAALWLGKDDVAEAAETATDAVAE